MLQDFLYNKTAQVIHNHSSSHINLEFGRKRHELQSLIDLGNEFRGAGECNARHEDYAPVHTAIFADAFAERATLVVDCEG